MVASGNDGRVTLSEDKVSLTACASRQQIQQRVHFAGGLMLTEFRPWKQRKAEVES